MFRVFRKPDFEHKLINDDEFDALVIEPITSSRAPLSTANSSTSVYKTQKFPAKQHARKVADVLKSAYQLSEGLIYLPGEPTRYFEDSDLSPAFRQRRYFFYLSGADIPDSVVTYDLAKDELVLWIPFSKPEYALWHGEMPSADDCRKLYDVDDVRYTTEVDKYVTAFHNTSAAPLLVIHPDQLPLVAETLSHSMWRPSRIDHIRLQPSMDHARVTKTAYEISQIRTANKISSLAHAKVAERLHTFTNERHIEALFTAVCIAQGARNQAYPVLVGAGTNASTLHPQGNSKDFGDSELVLVDAGCEWNCYASDITRTFPLRGSFSSRGREIYQLVEHMQNECIKRLRPGVRFYDVHLHACAVGLRGLMDLGILKGGTEEEIWKAGTVAAFFPHGLGHHVGLETHDVSGVLPKAASSDMEATRRMLGNASHHTLRRQYTKNRAIITPKVLARAVQEVQEDEQEIQTQTDRPERPLLGKDMIVTIEPGIYFCRPYLEGAIRPDPKHAKYIDWELLEKYYPVGGVRIEDDLLLTEDGNENLTTAPKTLDDLQALIKST